MLVDGHSAQHRFFGASLLVVFGLMIAAAMKVLFSSAKSDAEIVTNAVTVLFIADVVSTFSACFRPLSSVRVWSNSYFHKCYKSNVKGKIVRCCKNHKKIYASVYTFSDTPVTQGYILPWIRSLPGKIRIYDQSKIAESREKCLKQRKK